MGVSFSTTTTTTHHHHQLDYFPHSSSSSSYPAAQSLPVHPPFYDSHAYAVCNHTDPFVGQPYFGPLDWQQPPVVVAPPSDDQKTAKVVNSEVNVHKDSLRLEADELNPDRLLVSFVFDALLDGR